MKFQFDLEEDVGGFGPKHVTANAGGIYLSNTYRSQTISLSPRQIEQLYTKLFVEPAPVEIQPPFYTKTL